MKIKVQSATLNKYNANSGGRSSPDCVKRAISIAFDLPYVEVSKLLNAKMKEKNRQFWNIEPVYQPVIQDLGGSSFEWVQNKEGSPKYPTVDEFADDYAEPGKTYILEVGKKAPRSTHLVTIRNKEIWDSWDCRQWEVCKVSELSDSVSHKEITNIKDSFEDLFENVVQDALQGQAVAFLNKHGYENYTFGLNTYKFNNYRIDTVWKLTLPEKSIVPKRIYNIRVNLVFEPTMTEGEAVNYINKVGKQRMYDRLWTIDKNEASLKEEAEMRQAAGVENTRMILTKEEDRFLNTLPGWARALITWVDVDQPGKYSDSYQITMWTLPDDTLHEKMKFRLRAYNADEIREYLDVYKKSFEIEGIDYYDY